MEQSAPTLNPRQELFIREYLVDMNGAAAARRAGYSAAGSSVQAVRLLKVPAIAEAIRAGTAKLHSRIEARVESVLAEWCALASDPKAARRDRLHALDSLARYLGMFIERRHVVQDTRRVTLDLSDPEARRAALDLLAVMRSHPSALSAPEE